jgi:hypothetical protein
MLARHHVKMVYYYICLRLLLYLQVIRQQVIHAILSNARKLVEAFVEPIRVFINICPLITL